MLTIGSLFSGIGGLELGLERAGLGPVLFQCEIDPYCRAVLAKHWPHVTRYRDVRTVRGSTLPSVDLLCGGFPCQDVSSAGKGAGLDGDRSGLWFEFRRLVDECEPSVRRGAHGVPRGLDGAAEPADDLALPNERISALGNAVVPQVAEVVGGVIWDVLRST